MRENIYVIIPVYNRISLTRQCLTLLRSQSIKNYETIVIDDASTDGTYDMIKSEFPEVYICRGNGNLWWTGAINHGINYALRSAKTSDFILTLNDDVIFDKDYLAKMYYAASIKPNSIIGSVEVDRNDPDIIVNGGTIVNWRTAKNTTLNRQKKISDFPKDHFEKVSILPGRGTLFPMSVFKDVGLFDEYHFKQCGDTELPRRAQIKGYGLFVYYDAVVITVNSNDSEKNINTKSTYRISDIKTYYMDIRSNFRIKYRWHFAKNTIDNKFSLISFFMLDLLRITYHLIKRLKCYR